MTSTAGRQIHPVVLKTLLEATGRYQPELKRWLLDEYELEEDKLAQLSAGDEELSAEPVRKVQTRLLQSPKYQKIVELAGANAYEELSGERPSSLLMRISASSRLSRAVRKFPGLIEPCLGGAEVNLFRNGGRHRMELRRSLFAEGRNSLSPLCGFYSGFLQQMLIDYDLQERTVQETSCRACHQEDRYCEFSVGRSESE